MKWIHPTWECFIILFTHCRTVFPIDKLLRSCFDFGLFIHHVRRLQTLCDHGQKVSCAHESVTDRLICITRYLQSGGAFVNKGACLISVVNTAYTPPGDTGEEFHSQILASRHFLTLYTNVPIFPARAKKT